MAIDDRIERLCEGVDVKVANDTHRPRNGVVNTVGGQSIN
jgi:hypothetical protein